MNRAMSEVLGYVFVFSLIVGSVALVYTMGYPALQDAREASATENVERAFDVLGQNLGDIQLRGAPSRATEIRLAGGTLSFGEPTTVSVSVKDKANTANNTTLTIETRPVVYEDTQGRIVTFEHGAIARGSGTQSTFVETMDWHVGSDRSIIPLATIGIGETTQSISGKSTVLVVFQKKSSGVPVYFEPASSQTVVNVTVTSNRPGAWQEYFESQNRSYSRGIDVDSDASDGTVYWEFETDEVYISRTGITARMNS